MQKRFGDSLSPVVKYWIFLCGIIIVIFTVIMGSFAASYYNLPPEDQLIAKSLFSKLAAFPFVGSIILVVLICSLISLLFQKYIIPVLKMAEQTRLITSANRAHRITTEGARELQILAEVINESADAFQQLQEDVDERVHQANYALKQERNRFAALMSELPYGVVVCSLDGAILLYNQIAREMLQADARSESADSATLGLGRSIFDLLDREPVLHALDIMNHTYANEQIRPLHGLMTKLCRERFIRVNMAPVTSLEQETEQISGFILSLEDISSEIDANNERDRKLQGMIDSVQNSLGQIHQGIDTICSMPGSDSSICNDHRQTILQVSTELEQHLAMARKFYSEHHKAYGIRENVRADTLLAILARNLADRFEVELRIGSLPPNLWLKIDSYAVVQAITTLVGKLKAEHSIRSLSADMISGEQFVDLVLGWPNRTVPFEALSDWMESPLFIENGGLADTPQTIASRHSGQIHCEEEASGHCRRLSFSLPWGLTEQAPQAQQPAGARPISYEFDLFHQPGQDTLGQMPLRQLNYVIFDTETTGLNPSDGDEIIQIGAVRVIKNRLLRNETFDQLVDPQRSVPQASTKVHGIRPEHLTGQPHIGQVLPAFHRFVKGSVLVAHNAAFDMRFLQLKENVTEIRFDNPVLDTLLLSSVVHPHQEGHSLDAIAERFGIEIVARHSAIGDALLTAEVLLRLIPLLEAQGIQTLDDALQASLASPFNKVSY
ncbi:MAG: exonuclease domain-containing protein [Desulfuromonadales bacterium]|nr:exonuclease domain-containing protein [Desulfuromonadales bacterium]